MRAWRKEMGGWVRAKARKDAQEQRRGWRGGRKEGKGGTQERRQKMEKGVGNRKENKERKLINGANESLSHSNCSNSLELAQRPGL